MPASLLPCRSGSSPTTSPNPLPPFPCVLLRLAGHQLPATRRVKAEGMPRTRGSQDLGILVATGSAGRDPGRCQFPASGQKVGTLRQVLSHDSCFLPGLASFCQGLGLVSESWPGSRLGPRQILKAKSHLLPPSPSPLKTHKVRPLSTPSVKLDRPQPWAPPGHLASWHCLTWEQR